MGEAISRDLTPDERSRIQAHPSYNADIAPTSRAQRTWNVWHIAALWVGMAVCIPTYTLAAGLITQGMNWWEANLTVALGNTIVLIPMILNAHAGAKYGIPFPVFARASFGVLGSNVPALLRALVACGWFGIQAWIGGWAIYQLLRVIFPGLPPGNPTAHWPGALPFACFLFFWAINVYFIWKGTESIKWMETLAAPFLILSGLLLLGWAHSRAGGWGPMLSQPDQFDSAGSFLNVFFPGLTAMVGYWATLSLNIPDFTRYARSQRDQVLGQLIGLPTTMTLFAFIGTAVTSATLVIFGEAIWDPVMLVSRIGSPGLVIVAMLVLSVATLSTNIAANVVSPANDFSNLAPRFVSFKTGGLITAAIGILIMPWRLYANPEGYIFTWLIGYSALLGPIGGVLICDYFLVRGTHLEVAELFRTDGIYHYQGGFNLRAIAALLLAIAPNVPGFLGTIGACEVGLPWMTLYHYAWFIGFIIAVVVYYVLMMGHVQQPATSGRIPIGE
ncbi:MAG: NCS1 family nucleobase:cation symporter-1 [Lentisphaerae bacterium]|nr:NCS1 family nucleobase:cation symporter-1 [Lentisphaerota bacterium]